MDSDELEPTPIAPQVTIVSLVPMNHLAQQLERDGLLDDTRLLLGGLLRAAETQPHVRHQRRTSSDRRPDQLIRGIDGPISWIHEQQHEHSVVPIPPSADIPPYASIPSTSSTEQGGQGRAYSLSTVNILSNANTPPYHHPQFGHAHQFAAPSASLDSNRLQSHLDHASMPPPQSQSQPQRSSPSPLSRPMTRAASKRMAARQPLQGDLSPGQALSPASAPTASASAEGTRKSRQRDYNDEQWDEKFRDLQRYRDQHGDCSVPYKWGPDPKLAQWVKRQRFQYKLWTEGKHTTLSEKRREDLERIGFVWRTHDEAWTEHLNELAEYAARTGNCDVPNTYPEDPQLSLWVKSQRRHYKSFLQGRPSPMTQERIDRLERIGFQWTAPARRETDSGSSAGADRPTDSTGDDSPRKPPPRH